MRRLALGSCSLSRSRRLARLTPTTRSNGDDNDNPAALRSDNENLQDWLEKERSAHDKQLRIFHKATVRHMGGRAAPWRQQRPPRPAIPAAAVLHRAGQQSRPFRQRLGYTSSPHPPSAFITATSASFSLFSRCLSPKAALNEEAKAVKAAALNEEATAVKAAVLNEEATAVKAGERTQLEEAVRNIARAEAAATSARKGDFKAKRRVAALTREIVSAQRLLPLSMSPAPPSPSALFPPLLLSSLPLLEPASRLAASRLRQLPQRSLPSSPCPSPLARRRPPLPVR